MLSGNLRRKIKGIQTKLSVHSLRQKVLQPVKTTAQRTLLFTSVFVMSVSALSVVPLNSLVHAAGAYQLTGTVTDQGGNSISGAEITATAPGATTPIFGPVATSLDGSYQLGLDAGVYDIHFTPPAGSSFTPTVALSQNIADNTTLNVRLVPTGQVTLSGHVYNSLGDALPNQTVSLRVAGASAKTDPSGFYSITVAPGPYTLEVISGAYDPALKIPAWYDITANSPMSLTQSKVLNVTVPVEKATVRTQDSLGNPINNVTVSAYPNNDLGSPSSRSLSIGGGVVATGQVGYGSPKSSPVVTGPNGDATMWLLPNDSSGFPYTFKATPPSGSGYLATTQVSSITSDTTVTIPLKQPITVSGHVFNAYGDALPNQTVILKAAGASAKTDPSGFYSITVAPGSYTLEVISGAYDPALKIPAWYDITANSPKSFTQNTTLDLTIPAKKVTLHTKDTSSSPVSNVSITTYPNNDFGRASSRSLSIGGGIIASGQVGYGSPMSAPVVTDPNGDATMWLLPTDSSGSPYTFTATPPSGSGYLSTKTTSAVTTDTDITIGLQQPVTLSGHVYDSFGNLLPNQTVILKAAGASVKTNSAGFYSITVAPGSYTIEVSNGSNYDPTLKIPAWYDITANSPMSLTENKTLDLTIPVKKVSVHLQDPSGNPINNVAISTYPNNDFGLSSSRSLSVGGGITASGQVGYGSPKSSPVVTDVNGNATMWLLPSDSTGFPYTFTATPPSGSIYKQFILSNISVSTDQTVLISLQYAHNTPATTAMISPDPYPDGTHPEPATVTLSATAADGYSIANTYYTVDGGTAQTYSAPFTVSGEGSHTVTYWSVDNTGVQESHNAKIFTVHINQAPIISPLSGTNLSIGGSYAENGSFTDPDSTSWTATVDYGDGSGTQNLPLAGNTFVLGHIYNTEGNYTVTVAITDNQGVVGAATATVTVIDTTAPTVTGTPDRPYDHNSWYNNNVTITWATSDPDSPATTPAPTIADIEGINDYTSEPSCDPSGNCATGTITLGIDKIAPGIAPRFSASPTNGWYNGPLTVAFDCTDTTSGIDSCTPAVDLSQDGIYIVTGTAVDKAGNITEINVTVQIDSTLPTVANAAFAVNPKLTTDAAATLTAEVADPLSNGSASGLVGVEYYDPVQQAWLPMTVSGSTATVTFNTPAYTYTAGTYTFQVRATDVAGNVSVPASASLLIKNPNQAPAINPLNGGTIAEGDAYNENGTYSDPESTSWTATVDYGDGLGVQSLPLSGTSFALGHVYQDEGMYTVTVSVTDDEGATTTTTTTVTVTNAAASISPITTSGNLVLLGSTLTASATFTDPGNTDTHTTVWDWGDGSAATTGTITESNGSGSVTDAHTYSVQGVYTITLTITDNDGAVSTRTFQYVAVYNKGRLAGGDQFNSPIGASIAAPWSSGVTTFGISVDNNAQGQVTGTVKMDFDAGNVHLVSDTPTALVTTADDHATLRGTGTVNGVSGYTYLVTAFDGKATKAADTIRFQIKNASGQVIYDTQMNDPDTDQPTTPLLNPGNGSKADNLVVTYFKN